jgi:hypothetical protein
VDIVGYVALGIVAVLILVAIIVVMSSLPDIRRYSRLRKM